MKSHNISIKGFQNYTNNTKEKANIKDEDMITRRVPILTMSKENQEFSIFYYLINDMMKENTN